MAEYKLAEGIVELSQSDSWKIAKGEWALEDVYEANNPETCLCGHFPIIEICVLRNKENCNTAVVGNYCVKKFIGLPSNKIFQSVKRVRKDNEKSLNVETIKLAVSKGWIKKWEAKFYIDLIGKRNLPPNILNAKKQINLKVLSNIQRE